MRHVTELLLYFQVLVFHYVFKTLGKNGYGGDISMLMAVNIENKTIVGFKVLKHSLQFYLIS